MHWDIELTHKNEDAGCKRLRQIPGVGPMVSTATVASHRQRGRLPEVTLPKPGLEIDPV